MNNENRNVPQRKWVKDAAIIFLSVMLILTFFSSTIMNMSLPEVSGQYAGYGTVTANVRGTGTVSANMGYGVQISESRKIKKVMVRTGDVVAAGDILVLLEDSEGTELLEARKALSDAEYSYRQKLLSSPSGESAEIENLREDLAVATKKLENYESNKAELDNAKARVRELEAEIKLIGREIEELTEKKNDAQEKVNEIEGGKNAAQSAEKAYKNALEDLNYAKEDLEIMKQDQKKYAETKKLLETLEEELETVQEEYNNLEQELSAYGIATAKEIAQAKSAYISAQQEASDYKKRYLRIFTSYNDYLEAYNNFEEAMETGQPQEEIDRLYNIYKNMTKVTQSEVNSAKSEYDMYEKKSFDLQVAYYTLAEQEENLEKDSDYWQAKQDFEEAEKKLDEVQNKHDSTKEELAEIQNVTNAAIESKEREIRRSENELAYLKEDYEEALEEFGVEVNPDKSVSELSESGLGIAKEELSKCKENLILKETELEEKNDALEDAKDKYEEISSDNSGSEEQLKESVKNLERQLKTALTSANKESALTNLELERIENELEEKREKVAELEQEAIDAEVTAKYDGVISAVNVIAGDTANAGEPLVSIDVSGKGYTLSMPVSNEQSRYVKVGDVAKVLNYWGDIKVQLSAIKTDRNNPTSGKILEFDVNGDVTDGQNLNITVGDRQSSYDFVVPNSAVREDSTGTFVYIAEAKSTPLGNRFIARRVDVTVVSKDTRNCALDVATEYRNQYVIVNSSTPLTDGMQVRLVGN